VVAASVSAPVA